MVEEVALALRVVNGLPDAEYPEYAFAGIPDALTLPDKVSAYPSKLAIVPVFAARYMDGF